MALPPVLQNFVDGPKLPKVVLGVVGVAVLGALGYFFVISPIQARIDELVKKRTQVAGEVNVARAQVAELERFRREIAELEKRLALLKDRLPSEKETPTLYRALSTAAEQAGLGVALFQPKEALPKDVVNEIPIIVSAQGSYHQLAKFFERVAGLPRVVTVNDFKMTGLGGPALAGLRPVGPSRGGPSRGRPGSGRPGPGSRRSGPAGDVARGADVRCSRLRSQGAARSIRVAGAQRWREGAPGVHDEADGDRAERESHARARRNTGRHRLHPQGG